ncbi:hypothetical protein [Leisingera sp. McT4-56]|uniref:hypothetical protein n=1 Tax=Leisingera sp. McT4-56 TaxID=2881255 RepID=UPI001CF8A94F|nr:hypothetical protein [Leisingera sp. McT4-56]MCB4456931.1 hypothetical protein [Leisingera sp. McT4-56]
MKPWALFSHSVGMLTRNFSDMLRVFLIPTLLIVALSATFLKTTGLWEFLQWGVVTPLPEDSGLGGPFFLVVVLSLLIGMWSVVAWHRFVLLEEMPQGWMPHMQGSRIMAYFGRSVQIALVLICMMIPVMLFVLLVTTILSGAGPAALQLINLPIAIFVTYLVLRLSVILPAAALGADMGLRDAWNFTGNAFGDLLGLAAILVAAQYAAQFIAESLAVSPSLAAGVSILVSAALALLNISILTTLYGHYVEGRPV